jgi:hypothetical protein
MHIIRLLSLIFISIVLLHGIVLILEFFGISFAKYNSYLFWIVALFIFYLILDSHGPYDRAIARFKL